MIIKLLPLTSANLGLLVTACRGIIVVGLVKEEVGRQLLVLVAREISLDGLVSVESQTA